MKLLVIDTETGGLDPAQHSLLTLAGVVYPYRKGEPVLDVAVREDPYSLTAGAMDINKIDIVEHHKNAVTPAAAWTQLLEFIQNTPGLLKVYGRVVLAGHNTAFDIGFLKRLHRLSGSPTSFDKLFSHRFVDTMAIGMFAQMCGQLDGSLGLSSLLELFGLKNETAHNALSDATATALLLERFANTTQFDLRRAA